MANKMQMIRGIEFPRTLTCKLCQVNDSRKKKMAEHQNAVKKFGIEILPSKLAEFTSKLNKIEERG